MSTPDWNTSAAALITFALMKSIRIALIALITSSEICDLLYYSFDIKDGFINHYENKVWTMVMRIKFVKELNEDTGLKTTLNEPFLPNINNLIYTVTFDSNNLAHLFIGSTEVASGVKDALLKLFTAGHAHLVSR